jgi:hypothetical protein
MPGAAVIHPPFDYALLISSPTPTLTVRWSIWPSKLAGCLCPHIFQPRRGRKLDKTIGFKTVRISSRLTMERQLYCSVKNGFDSAILTKIPRMKKEERAGSSTDD